MQCTPLPLPFGVHNLLDKRLVFCDHDRCVDAGEERLAGQLHDVYFMVLAFGPRQHQRIVVGDAVAGRCRCGRTAALFVRYRFFCRLGALGPSGGNGKCSDQAGGVMCMATTPMIRCARRGGIRSPPQLAEQAPVLIIRFIREAARPLAARCGLQQLVIPH